MSQTRFSLTHWILIAAAMYIVTPTWGQEDEQNAANDPCADLLAIENTESTSDEDIASKQLELSIARLDECLNHSFGLEGASTIGNGGGAPGGSSSPSQIGENGDPSQGTESFSSTLTELDEYLQGLEIELEPLDSNARSPSRSNPSNASRQTQSEPQTPESVSGGTQQEMEDGKELKGGEVDNESQHSGKNREPADPKDEDAVLKQIREAAERETNPETKKALWDQYYDYLDSKKRR